MTPETYSRVLSVAVGLACEVHAGQLDKAGAPYILHPLRVMDACYGPIAKIVAVLHDVIEDAEMPRTAALLWVKTCLEEAGAGSALQTIMYALDATSREKGEVYKDYIERVAKNAVATHVKLADLEDNMSRVRRMPLPPETRKALEKLVAERYEPAYKKLLNLPTRRGDL